MRVIFFLITAALQLAAAAFGFFVLLLSLNGYGERQATSSLLFYISVGVVSAAVLGWASALTPELLVQRCGIRRLAATATVMIGALVIGLVMLIVGLFAALLIAEMMPK